MHNDFIAVNKKEEKIYFIHHYDRQKSKVTTKMSNKISHLQSTYIQIYTKVFPSFLSVKKVNAVVKWTVYKDEYVKHATLQNVIDFQFV